MRKPVPAGTGLSNYTQSEILSQGADETVVTEVAEEIVEEDEDLLEVAEAEGDDMAEAG